MVRLNRNYGQTTLLPRSESLPAILSNGDLNSEDEIANRDLPSDVSSIIDRDAIPMAQLINNNK